MKVVKNITVEFETIHDGKRGEETAIRADDWLRSGIKAILELPNNAPLGAKVDTVTVKVRNGLPRS